MLKSKSVYLLLNREVRENKKSFLLYGLSLTVGLFMLTFMGNVFVSGELPSIVPISFVLSGLFLAADAYLELKDSKTAQQYLLIPATAVEKVAAKTIMYTFGSALLYVVCLVVAVLATFIAVLIGGAKLGLEQLLLALGVVINGTLANWYTYSLLTALAAFASVYFRRQAFVKLVASCGLILAGVSIIMLLEVVVLYHGWSNVNINLSAEGDSLLKTLFGDFKFVGDALSTLVRVAAIPLLWALTWLRLRETEA